MRVQRNLASLKTVLVLLSGAIAVAAARADTYPITYKLDRAGNVSVNVYDSSGAIVRELLHAASQSAGEHTLIWDGLDRTGKGVAPGAYGWKLLQTPSGLSSQYLLKVGDNYPIGIDMSSSGGPGTHNAPYTVAIDETGTYISALQTENIETCMLKLSGDGGADAKRIWDQKLPMDDKKQGVAWEGARSIAVDRGEIYLLGHTVPQRIFVSDAATGAAAGRTIAVKADGDDPGPIETIFRGGAADMDVHDGVLVVAYIGQQKIRWFDPKTGELLDTASVPGVQGVAVGNDGVVYATTADSIVRLTRAAHDPVTVAKGLTQPGRIDIDHSTNELIVQVGGDAKQQILRIVSADGKILRTYGAAGGRQDGLYEPTNFAGVADVTADGHGGFFVAEPYSAPRRVAHLDGEGKLIHEWYGGQRWAPQAAFEPGTPEAMWVCSTASVKNDERWIMRILVDYERHSWRVHSCYRFASAINPLMHDSGNESGMFRVHEHAGIKYLAMESLPSIWRIDEKAGRLIPATAIAGDYQWNDVNGDGLMQDDEKTKFEGKLPNAYYVTHVDANLDYFFIDSMRLQARRFPVVSWNAAGAPVYGNLPEGEVWGACPPRFAPGGDGRWGAFLFHDTVSGRLYAALNPVTHDWCTSIDTFVQQWDAKGKLTWAAGERGPAPLSISQRFMFTEPGLVYWGLRGLAGVAHGCLIAIDVNGGWFDDDVAHTYVWDADGLFVGGIMDHIDLKAAPQFMYRCGGEFCHSDVYTLPNGDVLFSGNWESDSRIYKVTGWNDWQRQSGAITVKEKSADDRGQGLTLETIDAAAPDIARDVRVQTPDAAAVKAGATVRWRGTVCPTFGPKYNGIWPSFPSPAAYHGGQRRAHTNGATCEFKFHGTSIAVVGAKSTDCGYVNVYLDGAKVLENFDCYDSAGAANVTYFSKSDLPAGDHTITVEAVGALHRPRNPKASDAWVYIDKFVVDGVDVDDDGFAYTFTTSAKSAATQLWLDKRCMTYDGSTEAGTREKTAPPMKLLRRAYPIQLDATTTSAAGSDASVTLSWSSAIEPKKPVPAANLFPVTITPPIPPMRIACTPLEDDAKTLGNWKGVYGRDGFSIAGGANKPPAYVALGILGTHYTWGKPDAADERAPQQPDEAAARTAGAWYAAATAPTMTFDLNFTDGRPHQFSLYLMDQNRLNFEAKVEVLDVVGQPLASREIALTGDGRYVRWILQGHVSVRVSNMKDKQAPLVLGMFFDPVPAPPAP